MLQIKSKRFVLFTAIFSFLISSIYGCRENTTGKITANFADTLKIDTVVIENQSPTKDVEQIVFGSFCGECAGHCATMYRYQIEGGLKTLCADYTDSFFKNYGKQLMFGTEIKDKKLIELSDEILQHIPSYFLSSEKESERFGCPDCTDGCGYFFEIIQSGKTKRFYIDHRDPKLRNDIRVFVDYLSDVLSKFPEEK